MYKKASVLKLRFTTSVGVLTTEQLWDLTQTQLSTAIKAVKKQLNKDNDDELSFLEATKTVDVENQLRFDILKDVYMTKKDELEAVKDEVARKAHNKKIDELIASKQDEKLKDMSIEQLEAMRK